jgi:hypothetical protein
MPAMPRRTAAALGAVVLFQLFFITPARAQGSIADPPVTFTRAVAAFDVDPRVRFTGVSVDAMDSHVFELGWWYRIAGDAAEKFFPQPDAQNYTGDTSIITWNDVDDRGFRAVETAVVVDGGGPSGQVLFRLALTNLSATTPLGIDLFNMADLDVGGTTEGDSASLLNANDRLRFDDDGPDMHFAEYGAEGADAFLVRPFDGIGMTDVAGLLSNAVIDGFDNSGLASPAGDLTSGFQWASTVIPPSGTAVFFAGIAVNMPLEFPAGSTTTTTTSSTLATVTTTTSTTLSTELCDNCVDDDGDAQVDFEDGDCCAAAVLTLKKGRLRPRDAGTATVKLKAKLAESPLVADGVTQDVTLQLRGAGTSLCARFPVSTLVRRGKRLRFRDADGVVTSARGITAVTLVEKQRGAIVEKDQTARVAIVGQEAQLAVLGPGPFTLTLGFRDPATAETANVCASGTATFRPARRGVRYP